MIDCEGLLPDFWITQKNKYPAGIPAEQYEREEDERFIIWHSGVMARYDRKKVNWQELAELAVSENLVFSDYLGWYKIVIYDKKSVCWLFFGDSCGSQYLFMDCANARFSDRFLTLRAALDAPAEVDMPALTHMICRGTLFGESTLIKGLTKTDCGSYYFFRNGIFERRSKHLPLFSETEGKKDLKDVLLPITEAIGDKKACAVCTGGTDSRTVLAALSALGKTPELVLTAHRDNPDVVPAAAVARCLGRELTVLDPEKRDDNWLETGFGMMDGLSDAVLGYRHYLKASWAKQNGYAFEYGGVAGEFYKNVFYRPLRWLLLGKKDQIYYRRALLDAEAEEWFGPVLLDSMPICERELDKIAEEAFKETKSLEVANHIGYSLLSSSVGTITSGYAAACCKIDPLMDRALAAAASKENYMSHSMHMWQRKQIAKNCPRLSDLPTDQGYSCTLRPLRLFCERCKKLLFIADRVFNRIRRSLGLGFKSKEQRYWDEDYIEARKSELWQKALTYCREKGIIQQDVDETEIPLSDTGTLLLVGMLFADSPAQVR